MLKFSVFIDLIRGKSKRFIILFGCIFVSLKFLSFVELNNLGYTTRLAKCGPHETDFRAKVRNTLVFTFPFPNFYHLPFGPRLMVLSTTSTNKKHLLGGRF